MAHSTWHIYGAIFVYLFMCFVCQNVKTMKSGDRRPYEPPSVQMEYKMHIDPGQHDCYWQYVQAGATLFFSYRVI